MSGSVEIIALGDRERWLAEDARDGRPAQAWHYASAIARSGLEPRLALVSAGGARLRVPYYEREWRGERDIATWLGLSGASIAGEGSAPWALWREYAVAQGWVAGYVQLAHDAVPALHPDDRIASSNEVFVLDLDAGDPLALAAEIVRRKVRRAERAGVEAVDDPRRLADAFVRLYPQALERRQANATYQLDEPGMRALVAQPGAVVVGAALAGEVEAVAVFPRAGERAEYLCNACSEAGRELAAWQIARAMALLRAEGVRELNLGGGVAAGDGLHQFKARFHGRRHPLRSLQQVFAPARYAQLCADAAPVDGGWFPAYRRPDATGRG